MIRKIIAGAFALIMIGAVVAGVVALARGSEGACGGQGGGAGRQGTAQLGNAPGGAARGNQGNGSRQGWQTLPQDNEGQALSQTGNGQGNGGRRQGQNGAGSGVPATDAKPEEWRTVEGTVVALSDLTIELADGTTLEVGLGPSHYREGQGFSIEIGQHVAISGFDEGGEFKAGTIENLDTGDTIVLRGTDGRPAWAGQGRGQNRL
jgi:hypothetical protein